jgi:hypothetical protein
MRYYEIAQRPKITTATDRIVRDERHLQRDAGQVLPSGGSLRVSGNAAATACRHAPVPHPDRYRRVR